MRNISLPANEDFLSKVAKGLVKGHSLENKFGRNPAVANTGSEDVWDNGGDYPFQSTAQAVEIISDSTDDDDGGIGANTVEVFYYDNNGDQQSVVATMNGTTAVALGVSARSVYRMVVKVSGTSKTNVGNISVRLVSTPSTILGKILATNGQTLMAIYMVPKGKTAFLVDYNISTGRLTDASGRFFARPSGGSWNTKRCSNTYQNGLNFNYKLYPKFEELTEFKVTVSSALNNADITAEFDLLIVDNEFLPNS